MKEKIKFLLRAAFYKLFKYPVGLYLKLKFNIKQGVNDLKGVKGPFLLLGNHVTAFDPIIACYYSNHLIRFIAASINYQHGLKSFLLNMLGQLSFTKNNLDIKAIKDIKKTIKKGLPVGLYPEGGRNFDGDNEKIIYSTVKLIRLLKVPVYINTFKGGYLSKPRWADCFRRGVLIVDTKLFITPEEIKQLTDDELYEKLVAAISHNDYEWQRKNMIKYKGKNLAESIERLIYHCPNCHSYNSFTSKGNKFWCTSCNEEHLINEYGFIEGPRFDDTVKWNKWQQENLHNLINQEFSIQNKNVSLKRYTLDFSLIKEERVQLEVNNKGLIVKGENEFILSYEDIYGYSVTLNTIVDVYVGKTLYRFNFDEKGQISVYLLLNIIKRIKGEKKDGSL